MHGMLGKLCCCGGLGRELSTVLQGPRVEMPGCAAGTGRCRGEAGGCRGAATQQRREGPRGVRARAARLGVAAERGRGAGARLRPRRPPPMPAAPLLDMHRHFHVYTAVCSVRSCLQGWRATCSARAWCAELSARAAAQARAAKQARAQAEADTKTAIEAQARAREEAQAKAAEDRKRRAARVRRAALLACGVGLKWGAPLCGDSVWCWRSWSACTACFWGPRQCGARAGSSLSPSCARRAGSGGHPGGEEGRRGARAGRRAGRQPQGWPAILQRPCHHSP